MELAHIIHPYTLGIDGLGKIYKHTQQQGGRKEGKRGREGGREGEYIPW